ncbi:MAG: FAD-binding protein [Spirochaetales bacterium]|jgi:electron transfer flavoprotein alpha subunit|nr:FAD-binding protein [Spirochaetales bacterium]
MRYVTVLNGCSDTYQRQAEELQGFITENNTAALSGSAVIFYSHSASRDFLIEHAPCADVMLVKVDHYQPEVLLSALQDITAVEGQRDLYLFPADFAGSEVSVRLSYRLGGSALTNVSSLDLKEDSKVLICRRKVYSNHLVGTFELRKKPFVITAAGGKKTELSQINRHTVREHDVSQKNIQSVLEYDLRKEQGQAGLDSASFIIAFGRGVGSKEGADWVRKQTEEFNAEFGVTRSAAMNGWAPLNRMLGASGTIAVPELCIVLGASGAAAFSAGIEKSHFLVSVNRDKGAPIISNSDVAVIGDYRSFMEELVKLMKHDKTGRAAEE